LESVAQAGLIAFSMAISRDSEGVPPKPDPTAFKLIADSFGVALGPELLMVGDSPDNDIVFGKNAGVHTALLDSGRKYLEVLEPLPKLPTS
jgi:HAD superfamily hydrolase (TIGR01549 family)